MMMRVGGAAALWQTSVRTLVQTRCRHVPVTRLAVVAPTRQWNLQRGVSRSLDNKSISTTTEQDEEEQLVWEGRLKDAWKHHNNTCVSDDPEMYIYTLEQVRDVYVNLGSWENAFAMEVQLLKTTHVTEKQQTADAYHRMGSIQLQMQHFGEARRYYQLALAIFYDLHGKQSFHRDMGKMLIGLGGICLHEGNPEQALPLLTQAEMQYANHGMCVTNDYSNDNTEQQQPSDPHPEISVVFNNQALIYRMMGQHQVAIEKYKKMLVFYETYESDNEEKRDHVQLQIADCLLAVNQLSPAMEYFQTLLQNEVRRHGTEEKSTAHEGLLRHHIGVVHSKQGRMEDALRELESAYVIQKATLGEMHQNVASTLNALGAVHASIGNDGEALSYFRESLMIARIHAGQKGDEDQQVMQTLRNISLVHGDKVPKWN